MMTTKNISASLIKNNLPSRTRTQNKTHGGKILVVGGSSGMYGAALLCALAATRSGAGYTYVLMDWNNKQLLKHPDLLFVKPEKNFIKKVKPSAIVVGPGLGSSARARRWLSECLKESAVTGVLDADGLNWLARTQSRLSLKSWVLTPHEGELARLLNVTSNYVRTNPIQCALAAQKKWQCVVLLKGANTIVTDGNIVLQCKTGTPALAKAGTGDVLAGLIGAMLAQGKPPILAAAIGAYLHGLASAHWPNNGNDVLSMRPLDLIEQLPKTIKSLRR